MSSLIKYMDLNEFLKLRGGYSYVLCIDDANKPQYCIIYNIHSKFQHKYLFKIIYMYIYWKYES